MNNFLTRLLLMFLCFGIAPAVAQESKVVQSCGTVPLPLAVGSTQYDTIDVNGNKCIGSPAGGGGAVTAKSGSYASAGTGQFALAVATNTQLAVPTGSICAQITVETAAIRRTSDGTSATTTNGTLIQVGAQWQDCGPLAAYKFTAVSGSPTLDVEYFK